MINLTRNIWPFRSAQKGGLSQCTDDALYEIAEKASSLNDPCNIEEESYLLWVMGRLMMLDEVASPNEELFQVHPQGSGVRVYRKRVGTVEFCFLMFEPDGFIPYHDHSDCNGVMRVLKGEVTTRNYDLLEQTLEGMVLQPSAQAWMTAGRMASLSRHRDNVHQVTAGPDGALVLDVFTLFSHSAGCRYMKVTSSECWSGLAQGQLISGEGSA
ncbi:hypothetical protein [Endozoicomonas arenosclerae]|uniref:hypothetical protein n=1 Tax=Endozoicomonas arenosclerae TaxID=1633495 RepID=UPI000ABE3A10|nr:hypothetical protein [Endozoicomonas arenosclerae]